MTSTTRFSLCQLATPDQTFEEDVALARELGIGLGLDHDKLGDPADDDKLIELMKENGVAATICVAQPMTILPSDYVPDPEDVDVRMERIVDGIRRLARFDPYTVFVITGPEGAYGSEARKMAVERMGELKQVADEVGVKLSIEPMREENRETFSMLASMAETVEFIEDVGGDIGIVYDMWHMWNTPDILPMTEKHGSIITGVHVCDHREPTRSAMDRVLPGDGTIDIPSMITALEKGGFQGWWDLEVFSDDGRGGDDFPDSVWKRPTREWVTDGKQKFDRLYEAAHQAQAS